MRKKRQKALLWGVRCWSVLEGTHLSIIRNPITSIATANITMSPSEYEWLYKSLLLFHQLSSDTPNLTVTWFVDKVEENVLHAPCAWGIMWPMYSCFSREAQNSTKLKCMKMYCSIGLCKWEMRQTAVQPNSLYYSLPPANEVVRR